MIGLPRIMRLMRSYRMDIENAKYYSSNGQNVSVNATIDGTEMSVPLDAANRHYEEIMRQVEAGDLTIAEAE
jgi:5-hydroxyisourate hydrolase-like protein (transthyretin family)